MEKYVDGVLKVEAPKMEDFEGLYSKEEIEKDKREIERIKKDPKFREQHGRALIAAGIFYEEGERSCWLGYETNVILTSEFDDIKRGSDFVLEISQEDDSFERIAIDLTISEDQGVLEDKYRSLRTRLSDGKLTDLKYYYSEISKTKGAIENIPRAIVQIKKDQLEELCKNIADKSIDKATHPLQFGFLEEIVQNFQDQLLFVKRLNEELIRNNKPQHSLAPQKLEKALNIIQDILKQKEDEIKKRGLKQASRFWKHSLPHFL
ncbi:MAG: hypothetical protein AAB497_02515 [Patescibacteria group bacterium]